MKGLNICNMVLSKIIEVFLWVGVGGLIFGILCASIAFSAWNRGVRNGDISIDKFKYEYKKATGQELDDSVIDSIANLVKVSEVINDDGTINPEVIILTMVAAMVQCAGFALVFHNIHLIFKTSEGKTKQSKGETPFQPYNAMLLRYIAIFLFVMTGITSILSWFGSTIDFNLVYVFFGLLALSLSGIFAYGESLENKVSAEAIEEPAETVE